MVHVIVSQKVELGKALSATNLEQEEHNTGITQIDFAKTTFGRDLPRATSCENRGTRCNDYETVMWWEVGSCDGRAYRTVDSMSKHCAARL